VSSGPTNAYCKILGIKVPDLRVAKDARDANTYACLLVVLMERGEPVTLAQAAQRFEAAGIAPAESALASLKRCRPGRAPVYRDGDRYALDPNDHEADLWAFRLGLRPPKVPRVVKPAPKPVPSPDAPLTVAILDEAWRPGVANGWSAQRIAICVLDAHRKALPPSKVIAFAHVRLGSSQLRLESAQYWRRGAPIQVTEAGLWKLDVDHDAVLSARVVALKNLETSRRYQDRRPDPVAFAASQAEMKRKREEHRQELADMRRVLLHAFPPEKPEALVLLDVEQHSIATYIADEIPVGVGRLDDYQIIAAADVRGLLRTLNYDPRERRLVELSPPQKTRTINRSGRTLKITNSLLVQGSCGISRPFGDPKKLRAYQKAGELTKFRRRLEADAKSLFALYQYGRTQGRVRLKWGFIDEHLFAPWVHSDEMTLFEMRRKALETGRPLELVTGSAPGWEDPWARKQLVFAEQGLNRWDVLLITDDGWPVVESEVQLARICEV
jgi:hypothetical protein